MDMTVGDLRKIIVGIPDDVLLFIDAEYDEGYMPVGFIEEDTIVIDDDDSRKRIEDAKVLVFKFA